MSMNTRDIAAEYRLAHWTQIMRERTESGQSIKAFCENAGIRENTYFYWQKKLREAACEQLAAMEAGSAQTGLARSGFAEVRLRDNQQQTPYAETAWHGSLAIEIPGMRVTADGAYPTPKLAYLLRELVRGC